MTARRRAPGALAARNRRLFARKFPQVLAHLDRAKGTVTRLVEAGGEAVNIDLGGAPLYPEDAAEWASAQLQAFRDDPDCVVFDDPSYCNLSTISLKLLEDLRRHVIDADLLACMADRPVADVGYLFVFGVGLGHHLQALLEETPARHVVLIEPFGEFLAHALEVTDWSRLVRLAERRRIRLHFILADDPHAVVRQITNLISLEGNAFIEGSAFFQHYYCWTFRQSILLLKDRLKALFITSGFFEDELEMVRNAYQTLKRWPGRVIEKKVRREQGFPVILVGAGPSLDNDLPYLREMRERAIVVSCGTAIGILLKNGIRPDLHVEIERIDLVHTLLEGIRERFGFDGITLIASTTVDPKVPSLFPQTWWFVRGGLSPSVLFTPGIRELDFADPLCCNAAFAAMVTLGFRNIWLFGLDLAQKQDGAHHAKDSIYFESKHAWIDKIYRSRFDRVAPGNFGGEVVTYWGFDAGRSALVNAQALHRANLVNCSDGAAIDGAVPRVAAAVRLPESPISRGEVLARIEAGMRRVQAGELLADFDRQRHIDGCAAYGEVLDRVLDAWLATDDGFYDLEQALVAAVQAEMDRLRGYHMMSRGSVMGMLRLGAFFACRITDAAKRRAFRAAFAESYRRHCGAMAEEAAALLASLADAAPEPESVADAAPAEHRCAVTPR